MQFFQQLADLNVIGNLKITVGQTEGSDTLHVTILLDNPKCGDDARHQIKPFLLKGTAEQLDAGFFPTITKPLQDTSALQTNMEQYLKSTEQAKQKSQMEKEKEDKKRAEADKLKKAFDEAMKKVGELQEAKKYREAIGKLPDPKQYPGQSDAIKKRRDQLMGLATGSTSLFDTFEDPGVDAPADQEPLEGQTTADDEGEEVTGRIKHDETNQDEEADDDRDED